MTPSIDSRYSSLEHVADARRPAALDEVVQARRAGVAAGLRALAGAVEEHLAEQVERVARALGARVRAEVGAVLAVALAGEVDAREVLVEADRDVRVGLVVAQPDVEARLVLADEVLLGEQRLRLRRGPPGTRCGRPRAGGWSSRSSSGWRSGSRRACGSTSPCRRRRPSPSRRGTGRRRVHRGGRGAVRARSATPS